MRLAKKMLAFFAATALLLCSVPSVFVSAEAVVPRAVQLQWAEEWKDDYYGTTYSGSLYDTGCGIFSIVNAVGYLTGNEMSITEVAQWAYDVKAFNYYAGGVDRTILYPKLQDKYGEEYGFTVDCAGATGYWLGASSSTLKNHLLSGGVAIGHVYGHFIAVVGYDSSTGYFHVYDSAPSTARGTGNGDAWVSESWFTTSTKLTLDWFCLLTGTGYPINRDYGETGGTTAAKLGTYRINSNAPAADALNVRAGVGTSYDILTTVQEGDIIDVTELSGSWGKFVAPDGIEGWASIEYYADYIGVDALAYDVAAATDGVSYSYDVDGSLTVINSASSQGQLDLFLPQNIGTVTTPYMSLQVSPISGSGYYFGITQQYSAYWMMRDCESGDQLVNELEAPYMTNQETLEIDVSEWWQPTADYRINAVRFYLAPNTSIRIDYYYFAASSGVVTDTQYNLMAGGLDNITLMKPDGLSIADTAKKGSYIYDNGMLTVVADTDAGFDVVFDLNETIDVAAMKRLLVDVDAATPFNISVLVTHAGGEGWVSLASDFYPTFTDSYPTDGFIPAWTGTAGLDLYNYYNYNNLIPENGLSVVKQLKISLGAAGTSYFHAVQIASSDRWVTFADGVYKTDSSDGSSSVDKVILESDVYAFVDTIVTGVEIGSVSDFLSNVTSDYAIAVYAGDVVVEDTAAVATGQVVRVLDGTTVLVSYEIAVKGDVDGDGEMNTSDARAILLSVLGTALTDTQTAAADIDADGTADSSDARSILMALLN